jgi:restriction endonuclease Mrr
MTFTEAAIEVLRRAGKPLNAAEIAGEAVTAGLLSHVGQTPDETMGHRLLAMARREHDRKVVTLEPGVFALAEWGLPVPTPPEPVVVVEAPKEPEPLYRERERHPPLQAEMVVGARREEHRRKRDDDDGHRRKKHPPPAEVAYQWLRERGQPASLADIAHALREGDRIPEALERDLHSLERALKEENRRRQDSRRPPAFEFAEDGTVTALDTHREVPKERPERGPRPERPPRREEGPRPPAVDEQKRTVLRSTRRRLSSLDGAALERVAVALLEAQGYRDLNMARRSAKEGPLYLARRKWGAGELRYAVRVLRPGRDLGRGEVQDVRRDLQHYSAQIAVVIGTGECARESKSEANLPNQAPVMVYGGEALAEALVDAGLGVTKRLIEWLEYDDEFFASMGAGEALPDVEAAPPPEPEEAAADDSSEPGDDRQRQRDRRRGRGRKFEGRREGAPAPAVTETAAPPAETAPSEPPGAEAAVSAPAVEGTVVVSPSEAPASPPEAPVALEASAAPPVEAAPAPVPAPPAQPPVIEPPAATSSQGSDPGTPTGQP